ncbi:oxidoreductase [Sorangium cellulosum]|uniref:Oxidoreductase n=1 Tax=Sorangium cellulosum TaxID=56 RepID=A0A4P2Q6Y6_SORCE|nr:2-dehydropantoate 2-reductase N-terminal domain-containing protein [Sorangium cellulosum]AUX25267.1 oxidoreductase [Sorangium cellulosum]
MRISIVGAGALGRIYGVRLAAQGDDVTFVVRPERVADAGPFVIEQVNGSRRDALERPRLAAEIPADTEVVLVTVRFEQLAPAQPDHGGAPPRAAGGRSVADLLRGGPAVPAVVLTPLMPPQRAALDQAAQRRVTPAMPSASGYLDERGVVRYWITGLASTLIDEEGGAPAERPTLEELARRLTSADVPARLERGVGAHNAATTTAFFPLIAAIDAGGGVVGLASDPRVLGAARGATRECTALADRLGKVAPWAKLLTRLAGPLTLKPGIQIARHLFPEALRFVDTHFGPKLHAQHLAMGATILALGREHGVRLPSLEQLMSLIAGREAAR